MDETKLDIIDLGTLSQGTFGDKNENVASDKIVRTSLIKLNDSPQKKIGVDLPRGIKYIVYYGDTETYNANNLLKKLTTEYSDAKEFVLQAKYMRIKFAYFDEEENRQKIEPQMLIDSDLKFYYIPEEDVKYKHNTIYVASAYSSASEREYADYVCDGENDEEEIQKAIDEVCNSGGGTVKLSNGIFNIQDFKECSDGKYRAIRLPDGSNRVTITLKGESQMTGDKDGGGIYGTRLYVSKDTCNLFEDTPEDDTPKYYDPKYEVLSALPCPTAQLPANVIHLEEFEIRMATNQKAYICINLFNVGRIRMLNVKCIAYMPNASVGVAKGGCIGIRMLNGSNNGQENNFLSCGCSGFYEGYQVGGEHVVMINCSAIKNVYGYTFGNYRYSSAFIHPITLINCCDERGINLPYFNWNGFCRGDGEHLAPGKQRVNLLDFNIERKIDGTPGGELGSLARESKDGIFNGDVIYTVMGEELENSVGIPFFEKGSGRNFKVRNSAQQLYGDTKTRLSYAANPNQSYYDTDLHRMMYYIDGQWV